MRTSLLLLAWCACGLAAGPGFEFVERSGASLELRDSGQTVFVYNHGMMLPPGVPENRRRSSYLHPVYAPNGVLLTDDFPKDHYHHRGISWMWPVVRVGGQTYDLWTVRGIRQQFERWTRKEAGQDRAVLGVENGWYAGERKLVREEVEMIAHPVRGGSRDVEFVLRFTATEAPVELSGSQDGKGYGGFNVRFAPRTGTGIRSAAGPNEPDSDLKRLEWAELSADFGGQRGGVRITIDPSNPDAPNGWCLRHYGFLGVAYPGLGIHRLEPGKPLVLRYRVTLLGNDGR